MHFLLVLLVLILAPAEFYGAALLMLLFLVSYAVLALLLTWIYAFWPGSIISVALLVGAVACARTQGVSALLDRSRAPRARSRACHWSGKNAKIESKARIRRIERYAEAMRKRRPTPCRECVFVFWRTACDVGRAIGTSDVAGPATARRANGRWRRGKSAARAISCPCTIRFPLRYRRRPRSLHALTVDTHARTSRELRSQPSEPPREASVNNHSALRPLPLFLLAQSSRGCTVSTRSTKRCSSFM